jgi:hypothetical protein
MTTENGASHATHPSLRANGSRERAPDDRLREAIHLDAKKEWIASSQGRHGFAISRLDAPEICKENSLPS